MPTAITNPRSGSRLPALLALAHASLALYFWVCAHDVNLIIVPVRLWEVLSWSWFGWPLALVVLEGRLGARLVDRASGLANDRTDVAVTSSCPSESLAS